MTPRLVAPAAILLDRSLLAFDRRAEAPDTIRRAARLLAGALGGPLDRGLIGAIQERRLRRAIPDIARRSPFYRRRFADAGLDPRAIRTVADLGQLPFTTAADLRDWRRFLAAPADRLAAVFTTSGTTGQPKRVYYTLRDLAVITNLSAVALRVGHPGRLDALIALPSANGFWIGGAIAQRTVERAGGLPLPAGTGDPGETLRWLTRFEPNVLISSPSFATILTAEAARAGVRRRLAKILLGGERLGAETRVYLAGYWNAAIFDSYGTTEIGGAQTIALPVCTAFNLNDLHLVTEIVDPASGRGADAGELVFTTLVREAMPLLRYRSGDLARWADCPCGLPFRSIELTGRLDDMVVAGDMNLYGGVLATAVAGVEGASGRVEMVFDQLGLSDRLTVRVEGRDVAPDRVREALGAAYPELRANVAHGLLRLEVEPVASLGEQAKAFRIVDRRAGGDQVGGER